MTSKQTLFVVFTLMTPLLPAEEIHDTVESGEPAKVAALLRKDPGLLQAKNAEGDQALHLAALRDDLAMIELLLEAGADVNAKGAKGWTPLYYAGSIDSKEASIALLENGASRDALNDASQKPEQTAKLFTRKVIQQYNPRMAGADKLFTAVEAAAFRGVSFPDASRSRKRAPGIGQRIQSQREGLRRHDRFGPAHGGGKIGHARNRFHAA
jgi:hypothetical protein